MQFRILGSVEAAGSAGLVEVGGPKAKAVLVMSLLNANSPVGLDDLAEALWGSRPPNTAAMTIRTYFYRLRRAFSAAGEESRFTTATAGYQLRVRPGELDLEVFRSHLERARVAASEARFNDAVVEFNSALRLWRGHPVADATGPLALAQRRALEEARLAAWEERIAAELMLGRHSAVIPELHELVAKNPLRESLRAQLMLALYRTGRQAEALHVFQQVRRLLKEEFGVEPGAILRRAHRLVLANNDPADATGTATVPVSLAGR